jgi:hypothetical protein
MTFKAAALAAAYCALAGAGTVQAQAFAYAPGVQQYRITSTIKRTQQVGEQKLSDSAESVQVISVALAAKAKDTLQFTYTVDSLRTTLAEAQQLLSGMRGKKVTGSMSPQGEVFTFQVPADSTSPMGGQEYQSLRTFLIRFPNKSLQPGVSWTDTVSNKFSNMGIDGTETTVVTSRIVGDTTIAGQKAWRVQRSATATVTGSGSQNGQAIVVDGTRSIAGVSYMSRSGLYLGSNSTQQAKTTITAPAAGQSLIITQSATSRIERVAAQASGVRGRGV